MPFSCHDLLTIVKQAGEEDVVLKSKLEYGFVKADWPRVNPCVEKPAIWYGIGFGQTHIARRPIVSSYRDRKKNRFLIITEADRSATTILLPEEY